MSIHILSFLVILIPQIQSQSPLVEEPPPDELNEFGAPSSFIDDCLCPEAYDEPICCDTTSGYDPINSATDYANPCLAECNGITPPAYISPYCKPGTCEQVLADLPPEATSLIPGGLQIQSTLENEPDTDIDCGCDIYEDIFFPICCIKNEETGEKDDYDNPCLAACDGVDVSRGSGACLYGTCVDLHPCGCIPEYNPICCTIDTITEEKETFISICDADCEEIDLTGCTEGACILTQGLDTGLVPLVPLVTEEEVETDACAAICDEALVDGQEVCCDGEEYESSCHAVCAGEDASIYGNCVDGVCQGSITGIFSVGTPEEYSTMNLITIGIQLLILSVCCISIGCVIPSLMEDGEWGFELKMPRIKMRLPKQKMAYGPDL